VFWWPVNRNASLCTKPNTCIKGKITGKGNVKIDGNVEGDIEVKGTVIIGRHGNIKGNIISDNVELHGKIEGNITARNNLKLFSTAQLYGDASMKNFSSATGAVFVGNCIIIEDESERKNEQTLTGMTVHEENREINKEKPMEKSCENLAVNELDSSVKEDEDNIKYKGLDDFSIPVNIKEIEMEPIPTLEIEPVPATEMEPVSTIEMDEKESEKSTSSGSHKKFIIKKYD
jgi:cytoskeletal protein CcmA (bactofilin family)